MPEMAPKSAYFGGPGTTKINENSIKKAKRFANSIFNIILLDLTSNWTSDLRPFGHQKPLKNVSKIRPRKKGVQSFSCAALPVAPLPPITCSGKPAPKSDKGNVSADDELESKAGENKNNAWDLHEMKCNMYKKFKSI